MKEIGRYLFSEDLYYTKDHLWTRIEEGNRVRVGWSDFAQKIAGKVVYVKIKEVGSEVNQGDVFGSIETGKWVGKLFAPVGGVIREVGKIVKNPRAANSDPYGEGWFAVIEAKNLEEDLKNLLHGEEAIEWLIKEIKEKTGQEV
ncbi:MAG: glycine cleavage system protein H [Candidatus Jordarchaeum sp.]|uniref:glycine cleavage system protein H n=1 Tax=Candidatus Jordarchaeum sp. TaxID=2823881 RepID=UPI004049BD4E